LQEHYLGLSNPPHSPRGIADIAASIGLTPAEFRFKANYPVPEVWFADSDRTVVDALADQLGQAGLNVISVRGRDLADVPAAEPVRAFQFGERAFSVQLDGSAIDLPYESELVAVFCQTRAPAPAHESRVARDSLGARLSHAGVLSPVAKRPSMIERSAPATGEEPVAFLEIYAELGGALRRFAVVQGVVDLSQLPSVPRGADAMTVFVAKCRERFPKAHIDRRLVGMRPRQPLEVGVEVKALAKRKGFSFATRSLQSLLTSIEPSLETVDHSELASRLIYLTRRASGSSQTVA
jgi:hypothetical protein